MWGRVGGGLALSKRAKGGIRKRISVLNIRGGRGGLEEDVGESGGGRKMWGWVSTFKKDQETCFGIKYVDSIAKH